MFDPELVGFLESGCALIVGTVDEDGAPLATRGWGLTVSAGTDQLRLLLDADDVTTRRNLRVGGRIAITACDVPTLRSQQLKGHVRSVEDAGTGDRNRAERYCEAFYDDILQTDGTPHTLTSRLTPTGYYACTVSVDEMYDQTPGPAAGSRLEAASR